MSNPNAIARLAEIDARRVNSAARAQIVRSLGIGMVGAGANSYGTWSPNDPTSLARPPEDFTLGTFGPAEPMRPSPVDEAPDGLDRAQPRRWQYPPTWNMPKPPGSEGLRLTSFATLRALADMSSFLRMCIDKRVEEILGLEWDIVPTVDASLAIVDDIDRADFEYRRAQAIAFFQRPDPEFDTFHSWLRAALEDVFVIDALSIYIAPPRVPGHGLFGTDLAALALIAGETIRPMLDLQGGRPQPPAVAFQQYIYGVPRVDMVDIITDEEIDEDLGVPQSKLRGDQMLYLPYRRRTISPYGFSHVESVLVPASIELNKQTFQKTYYTEGNVPACVDQETEILTRQGWKEFSVLTDNDVFATRNPDTHELEWQLATDFHRSFYNGPMVALEGQSTNLVVTPNHRVLHTTNHGGHEQVDRADVVATKHNNARLIQTSVNDVADLETWTVPGDVSNQSSLQPVWSGDDFAAFMGMWLAEGCVDRNDKSRVYISQIPSSKGYIEFRDLLTNLLGHEPLWSGGRWQFGNVPLNTYLRTIGYSTERFIPDSVKALSPRQLEIFWHYYWLGDGDTNTPRIFTSSKRMANDLQEIAQLMGKWAIVSSDSRGCYTVYLHDELMSRFHSQTIDYAGMVYCVTVPNGIIYVRRNGKPTWTGNSWVIIGNADTPQQVRQWQDSLDATIGDIGARHQVTVLPANSKAQETKPNAFSDAYDMANKEEILGVFGLTAIEMGMMPTRSGSSGAGGMMGSARMAQTGSNASTRTGTKPLLMFLKRNLFDLVLQKFAGQKDMQWKWLGLEPEMEVDKRLAAETVLVAGGLRTRDEIRLEHGWKPWGLPLTAMPTVQTPTGVVSLASPATDTTNPDVTNPEIRDIDTTGGINDDEDPDSNNENDDTDAGIDAAGGTGGRTDNTPSPNTSTPLHNAMPAPGSVAPPSDQPTTKKSAALIPSALTELDQLRGYIRHGKDIKKFETTYLTNSALQIIAENLPVRGLAKTIKMVQTEIEHEADTAYAEVAEATATLLRRARYGNVSEQGMRDGIAYLMAKNGAEPSVAEKLVEGLNMRSTSGDALDMLGAFFTAVH